MLSTLFNSVNLLKPYEINKLDGGVLIQVSSHAKWRKASHLIAAEILNSLNELDRPGYIVIDLTQNTPGIEDLVITFNSYVRGSRAWLRHPNLKEFVLITCAEAVQTKHKDMRKIQLGDISIRIFNRLESALTFVGQGANQHTYLSF